ncbi:50S ribosomal protein L10 [Candidatus Liberibacter asiaticus]|uniref:Large ribosomal subunit protein uL10 n=22 Tax=Liberibacter asiaticus TaxID=34021 RepID=RL10_LIBAS|nr:50S ribosomal protein L10 [Candidatus Liberibacter asiaticus]P36249.1 RecName: Full=Large ribosomal subunit protein uL10; AltName: Full=50S ribosomal protein L10 [Candidatus Liberibacter asiaticus]AAA23107.1 ribosomal protein L10 [Candidatus Liberibacter asiaticus]ABV68881.1 50S ribosomal subunit protein L10 [Candidatus Liberibacter asiaticus]ACT56618.1 50S ribosomal protein L10 [Candidatus Liberibacter asiaticus str. psy62]AGH16386.1 50S ribosomal protein L10 [Candidatus Liberibacter asiat
MNRQGKSVEISELSKIFSSSGSIVVAHYKGISVAQIKDLRKKMREAGGGVKVAKNRLVKIAIRDTSIRGISDLFVGQSLIVYSDSPVIAPKISVSFSNDNNEFRVLGGVVEKGVLNQDSIKQIASLPDLEGIRAGIISAIQSNATRLVRLLGTPQTQVVRAISAFVDKNQQG